MDGLMKSHTHTHTHTHSHHEEEDDVICPSLQAAFPSLKRYVPCPCMCTTGMFVARPSVSLVVVASPRTIQRRRVHVEGFV